VGYSGISYINQQYIYYSSQDILIDNWDDELFLLSGLWFYPESKETFATVILTVLITSLLSSKIDGQPLLM